MAGALIFSFLMSGCNEEEKEKIESPKTEEQQTEIQERYRGERRNKMKVQIEDQVFTAELEKNPGAEAFAELLKEGPVTIQMNDYAGFEKVGSWGKAFPPGTGRLPHSREI